MNIPCLKIRIASGALGNISSLGGFIFLDSSGATKYEVLPCVIGRGEGAVNGAICECVGVANGAVDEGAVTKEVVVERAVVEGGVFLSITKANVD